MKTLISISKNPNSNIEFLTEKDIKNLKGGGGTGASPQMGCPPPTGSGSTI